MNILINNDKFFEDRGSIYTIYQKNKLPNISFVQDKISKSFQGVIRGFHSDAKTFKLINCVHGKIKLVTYDLIDNKKEEYVLDGSSKNSMSILIKPFVLNAHQCLSDFCIFYYKWSELYTCPDDQISVYYNDDDIDPQWDISFPQIVSDRDRNAQSLTSCIEKMKNENIISSSI